MEEATMDAGFVPGGVTDQPAGLLVVGVVLFAAAVVAGMLSAWDRDRWNFRRAPNAPFRYIDHRDDP
jgi:hypothetical protein